MNCTSPFSAVNSILGVQIYFVDRSQTVADNICSQLRDGSGRLQRWAIILSPYTYKTHFQDFQ